LGTFWLKIEQFWPFEEISTFSNDPWVAPFQNCVRQRRSVSKMAAITKNIIFFQIAKTALF
jgi:hypothetical protein